MGQGRQWVFKGRTDFRAHSLSESSCPQAGLLPLVGEVYLIDHGGHMKFSWRHSRGWAVKLVPFRFYTVVCLFPRSLTQKYSRPSEDRREATQEVFRPRVS
jgi:hypothetical protein